MDHQHHRQPPINLGHALLLLLLLGGGAATALHDRKAAAVWHIPCYCSRKLRRDLRQDWECEVARDLQTVAYCDNDGVCGSQGVVAEGWLLLEQELRREGASAV
jgi:hypothetical protein